MTGRLHHHRNRVLATSLLIVSLGATATAQESAPASQVADTTGQGRLQPIPVSEIPAQAITVSGLLTRIRETLRGDTALGGIDSQLVQLERTVTIQREAIAPDALSRAGFDDLVDIEQSWRDYEARGTALQARLSDRGTAVAFLVETLDSTRTRWTLTRDSTPRAEMPEELRERVVGTLARIDSVEQQLREPRARILSMRDRASEILVTVGETIDLIRDARFEARRQVLQRNSPPLWRMFDVVPDTAAVAISEATFSERIAELSQYFRNHPGRLWLQLLIAVAIAAAASGLRRHAAQRSTAEHPTPQLSLFDRPLAAGILIPLALARYLHPSAPVSVYQLMWLLGLLPLTVLIPLVLTQEVRKAGYLVIGVTGIALVLQLFITPSPWFRLAAVGVAAAGIVAFAWLLVAGDVRNRALYSGWWRAARAGAWLGSSALVVSVVANVFGYTNLSGLLVTGTIYTAFIALVAATAVAVLDSLLAVALVAGAVGSPLLRRHQTRLRHRAASFIRLTITILWIVGSLRLFRAQEPAYDVLRAVLTAQFAVGTWTLSLSTVLVFAVSIWLAVIVAQVTSAVLREEILPRMALPRGVPDAVARLTQYALIVLGLLFAFGAAGIEVTQLTIIVGALGVGIGFGLQHTVNNFISGIILLFERPIQIGDVVEIESLMGSVKHIGIRASVIRTFSGAEVIVPNGDLISGRLTNWTLSDQRRRVEIPIGVAYGSDPQRVIEILGDVAKRHPDTIDDPPPVTHFVGFGDSSLDFMVWAWTGRLDRWWQMRTDILTEAYAALGAAGIGIPFPQRDLHLRSIDPDVGRALGGHGESDP